MKKEFVDAFRNILSEGIDIMISDYQLGQNSGLYRYSEHPFKINFQPTTIVKVFDTFVGSRHAFNFRTFDEVLQNKFVNNQIIGMHFLFF